MTHNKPHTGPARTTLYYGLILALHSVNDAHTEQAREIRSMKYFLVLVNHVIHRIICLCLRIAWL